MVELPLITKYRPADWEELLGNEAMYASLRKTLASDTRAHAYLFTGPSGVGKTTTARLLAKDIGAEPVEIDAATYSTVDDVRRLVELANHRSLVGTGKKVYIVDECHAFSKSAWQAMLKMVEEPPEHLFIALCTTETSKVPATIVQRCFHVMLRTVEPNLISDFTSLIAELEGWALHNDVLDAIVQAANGSPRKALSTLQAVHDAESRDEVRRIIQLQDTSEPIIELIQYLLKNGKDWPHVRAILNKMEDADFGESTISVARYIVSTMCRYEDEKQAKKAWLMLDMLIQSVSTFDAKSAFIAAIGRMMWA